MKRNTVHSTMAEIAAELGLSRMYVSCVVNGTARRRGLSEKTIQRVLEHLDRRGYVPSRAARHLKTSPRRVVGILHVDSLFSHLIEAFHQFASKFASSGPALEIMVTPWERLKPAVQELLSRRVTDLVWIHNSSTGEEFRNQDIAAYLANMRTVIYNFPFDSPLGSEDLVARGISLVGVNRIEHTRRLAHFLKQLGHRVIVIPDVIRAGSSIRYYEAFEAEGLAIADFPQHFTVPWMLKVMKEQGVTALCFHGDSTACLALNSLRAAGVRVPEDLTVTGFDGMSRSYNQDLTTLAIPVDKMVAKVCEILESAGHAQLHCLDLELVEGRTHGLPGVKG